MRRIKEFFKRFKKEYSDMVAIRRFARKTAKKLAEEIKKNELADKEG